jgi:hypothetical protein
MSDDTPLVNLELPKPAIQPPRLSDQAIAAYREMLADKEFETRHPAQYEAIRNSVHQAIAECGQSLETPAETPAQAYDRRRGIVSGPDGSTQLPPWLHSLVTDAAKPQDAKAIDEHLARAGKDAAEVRASAAAALARAKLDVKLDALDAHALAQLAVWERALVIYDAARPANS